MKIHITTLTKQIRQVIKRSCESWIFVKENSYRKKANSTLKHLRTDFRSMMSEERLNAFPLVYIHWYIPWLWQNNRYLRIHSHKKRKDSLETQAEPAILCVYVENQAILEPILLYRASKYKQTKEQGNEDCKWTHMFTFSHDYFTVFFSFFFCQNSNITGSNCPIIGWNLSKKHKLALSQI